MGGVPPTSGEYCPTPKCNLCFYRNTRESDCLSSTANVNSNASDPADQPPRRLLLAQAVEVVRRLVAILRFGRNCPVPAGGVPHNRERNLGEHTETAGKTALLFALVRRLHHRAKESADGSFRMRCNGRPPTEDGTESEEV